MKANRQPDAPPAGPGIWVVSFSDCMTNLLTFFVMLLSFASFDSKSLTRIEGVFRAVSAELISASRLETTDSAIEPPERPEDPTEKGSESPTDQPPVPTRNPKIPPPLPDIGAHRGRHELRLPCAKMFWGQGSQLQPGARGALAVVAEFLARMPTFLVVIKGGPGPASLDRASAIVDGLTTAGIPSERFCLAADDSPASSVAPDIQILLLAPGAHP